MGFALPVAPMVIGAGAGALMDKKNPLRGAMLGAVGGSALGPAMSALTPAGSAAATAAIGAGEAAGPAASYGAAMGATAPGMASAGAGQQAAMLAAQTAEFGAPGLTQTLGSFGVEPLMAKGASLATMGPQGILAGMSQGDKVGLGLRGANMMLNQPQAQAPMPSGGGAAPPPSAPPPMQPMRYASSLPPPRRGMRGIYG